MMASPVSPKSPVTKHQRLGCIFGSPIASLDPTNLPKKLDVVKFWMYLFDNARTSWKMSPAQKNQVKDQILTALVSIWKSKVIRLNVVR